MRAMKVVDDPGFHRLMKTGRPHYKIPASRTMARDVHVVFNRVKERIAKMLQVNIFIYYYNFLKKLTFERITMAV